MKKEPSDLALINLLRGTHRDFEQTTHFLYNKFKGFQFTAKKRYPSLSDEHIQDAYTDAFDALIKKVVAGSYDPSKSSMSTYFCQIFFNKCIDQLRKVTNNKNEWINQLQELVPDLPSASVDLISKLVSQDDFMNVLKVMDTLKDPCKSLILDFDYWGFSPEEAAKRNGYKNGHSASQAKYRCLEALRKKIRRKNGS
ncbi:MAG: sigma-70 family RNA polymerase sigma factor [Bacteroidota bacterium]